MHLVLFTSLGTVVDYQNGEHDIELCTSITVRQCIVLFIIPFFLVMGVLRLAFSSSLSIS